MLDGTDQRRRATGIRADFERSLRVLRSLPADIWVTSHARKCGRWRNSNNKGDPAARITGIENVEIVFKDGVGYDTNKLLAAVRGHYGEY